MRRSVVNLYLDQGRYADAEPLLKRSLAIRENALGGDHRDVAVSMNNLASLYRGASSFLISALTASLMPFLRECLSLNSRRLGLVHDLWKGEGRLLARTQTSQSSAPRVLYPEISVMQ
jgi:hypothetical protein